MLSNAFDDPLQTLTTDDSADLLLAIGIYSSHDFVTSLVGKNSKFWTVTRYQKN